MQSFRTLSDVELLSELIGQTAVLCVYKGSLKKLFMHQAPNAHLYKLHVAREILERACIEDVAGIELGSPLAVKTYLRTRYLNLGCEVFMVIFLDVKNRLIGVEEMFRGTLTHTSVYPREVVKRALAVNAAAVIFSHNHPSGSAEPSQADTSITQALKQALALVEVKVLDHLIVGGADVYSFAERGEL